MIRALIWVRGGDEVILLESGYCCAHKTVPTAILSFVLWENAERKREKRQLNMALESLRLSEYKELQDVCEYAISGGD